jgi:hypothetical protein
MEAQLRARLRHAGASCRHIRHSRLDCCMANKGLALDRRRRPDPSQLALHTDPDYADEQQVEGHRARSGWPIARHDRDLGTAAWCQDSARYRRRACLPLGSAPSASRHPIIPLWILVEGALLSPKTPRNGRLSLG